jgi:hypothetical protein
MVSRISLPAVASHALMIPFSSPEPEPVINFCASSSTYSGGGQLLAPCPGDYSLDQ